MSLSPHPLPLAQADTLPPRYAAPCRKRKFYKKDGRVLRMMRHFKRQEKRFCWCEWCRCYHLTSEEKR